MLKRLIRYLKEERHFSYNCIGAGQTDTGRLRSCNGGEVASRLAVNEVYQYLTKHDFFFVICDNKDACLHL